MGPLRQIRPCEGGEALGAETRRRQGRRETQEKQESRSETVEDPFEVCERHDTHLFS